MKKEVFELKELLWMFPSIDRAGNAVYHIKVSTRADILIGYNMQVTSGKQLVFEVKT